MINITEISPPSKLSGISSLIITFDYNEEIINSIKSLDTFYYHKKEYAWEVPSYDLAKILDLLTFCDEVQLNLLPDDKNALNDEFKLSEEEVKEFKLRPYNHQIEGINFGLEKGKWLLLDSMGLGKTNEIIWYAETLKRRGLIDHCFIICGVDSLRQNWKKEIQKFSTESVLVLGEKISKKGKVSYETLPNRAQILKNPIEEFFIVTNIASIRSDAIVEAFNNSKNKFGLIAVDEIHRVATKTSQQGSNLLKLKAPYKVGATGTLITNNPLSAFVPLVFTENDHATLTNFKSQYCRFGGFNDSQVIGYKNLDNLREEIVNCSIRRTLDMVRDDMPLKTVTTELIEMDDDHKKFYEAIKDGVREEADKIELNSNNLLALMTRLRQATVCPAILTTQSILSSKVKRCVDIVEDIVAQGEKVVILSNFKLPAYQLAELLKQYKPLIITGDTSEGDASNAMELFQTDTSYKIIIGTHGKLGTGFTLNAAMYMLMLDTPWTDAAFSQSCDRIYRVNNTRPANITVLLCKDTVDERVQWIIENKKELADFIVDGKENSISQGLKEEMLDILRDL